MNELTSARQHSWVAYTEKEIFQTSINDYDQMARRREVATHVGDVLAVTEHGEPKRRPLLHCMSPQKLQITIQNEALTGFQEGNYQGIDVAATFDPDDPVAAAIP
jgi:hypothetical protein